MAVDGDSLIGCEAQLKRQNDTRYSPSPLSHDKAMATTASPRCAKPGRIRWGGNCGCSTRAACRLSSVVRSASEMLDTAAQWQAVMNFEVTSPPRKEWDESIHACRNPCGGLGSVGRRSRPATAAAETVERPRDSEDTRQPVFYLRRRAERARDLDWRKLDGARRRQGRRSRRYNAPAPGAKSSRRSSPSPTSR